MTAAFLYDKNASRFYIRRSLGVVAYVLLTGVSPFLGETKQDTLMNVTTAVIDFPDDLFGHMSSASQDFIAMMLQREPM